MVYIAPIATAKPAPAKAGKRAVRAHTEKDNPGNGRATLASVNKRLTSSQLAEAQAGDAKRILDRERQALRQARQASNDGAAAQHKDDQTSQQSQRPQAAASSPKQGHQQSSGYCQPKQTQMPPAHAGQEQGQIAYADVEPRSSTSIHTNSQPDQLGSYGLPYHAPSVTPSDRFADAAELASASDDAHHAFAFGQAQQSSAQSQFMSGLMSLHGITTPEEKRKREDKQKQYARELDEQVSQKRAARSAEQAKHNLHRQSDCQQPVTSVQQQQRQLPSRSITGPADEHESEHHQPWQAQKTQPAQHELQQKQSSSSLHEDASMGMAGVERGVRPRGGAAMTMTSELPDTNARAPPAPQAGRRGFMAGVAELKAGPTHEQQQHARVLRERLLADLQEQTEERRRAEAKRRAAEAAAEAKQEADIAAYHAQLREKETQRHHQASHGREDQPAATGAVRASPPESLTSSWNGPGLAAASHQAPSVVPRDPAVPGPVQHGRRQGRAAEAVSPSPSQELHQQSDIDARASGRPDSAAFRAKVGGVLAELQAEQARLRQLCSQQGSAMQDLQCQAQQAAKQHSMAAYNFQEEILDKARPDRGKGHCQGIPARRWGSQAEEAEEEEEGDSLDAFVVETRLVPVSLSQIPDRLPDNDMLDRPVQDALTHYQTYVHPQSRDKQQQASAVRKQQPLERQQQKADRQMKQPVAVGWSNKPDVGRRNASPGKQLAGRPRIWMC